MLQAIVKDVLECALADVINGVGVTTSMAVWTVTGIVGVKLRVGKVVLVVHVNAGRELVHLVTTGIGASCATNSAVKNVPREYAINLTEHVHHATSDTGVNSVTCVAAKGVYQEHVISLMDTVQSAVSDFGVIDVNISVAMVVYQTHVINILAHVHLVVMGTGVNVVGSYVVINVLEDVHNRTDIVMRALIAFGGAHAKCNAV